MVIMPFRVINTPMIMAKHRAMAYVWREANLLEMIYYADLSVNAEMYAELE